MFFTSKLLGYIESLKNKNFEKFSSFLYSVQYRVIGTETAEISCRSENIQALLKSANMSVIPRARRR
jgi:hypothetical protein